MDPFEKAAQGVVGGFDDAAAQVVDNQRSGLRNTLYDALMSNPDMVARSTKLGRQTGLAPELVERNLPEIERGARLDKLDALPKENPFLAAWLSDPANARIAHDDLDTLDLISKSALIRPPAVPKLSEGYGFSQASRDIRAAQQRSESAVSQYVERNMPASEIFGRDRSVAEGITEPFMRGLARGRRGITLLMGMAGLYEGDDAGLAVRLAQQNRQAEAYPIPENVQAGNQAISDAKGFGDAAWAILSNPGAVKETVIESMGISAPSLLAAGALSTFGPVGTAAGAGLGSFAVEYGATIQDVLAQNGNPSDPLAIHATLNDPDIMAAAKEKALARGVPIAIFDALTAGFAGKLLAGAKNTTGSAGLRAAGELGLQAAGGGAGEATAQLLTDEFKPGEILLEAIAELPTGLVEIPANYQHARDKAARADANAKAIEELNNFSKTVKVLQRDPETFQTFIAAAAEDGPVQNVFIDGRTLMQSGMAPALADLSPAVREQLDRSLLTGGMIAIPVDEYAARIAPTEFAPQLLEHLKTDEEGFSRAEAADFMANQGVELQAEVERVIGNQADADTLRASQDAVKADILGQLNTAGRFTPQVNEAYAMLIGSRTAVRAAAMGMTPEAFHQKYGMRVQGAAVAGDRFDQTGKLVTDTPAFKNWFGNSKVVAGGGKPLVVYHGTDQEFSSFDASRAGERTGNLGWFGNGFYFSANREDAEQYGSNIVEAFVSIKNPFVFIDSFSAADTYKPLEKLANLQGWTDTERSILKDAAKVKTGSAYSMQDLLSDDAGGIGGQRLSQVLKAGGFDGVVVHRREDWGKPKKYAEVVAFDPPQIKSAIGNRGTFDPADPNILNQSGYTVEQKGARDDYTLDLFGVPETQGTQPPAEPGDGSPAAGISRDDAPGKYASRTELVQENTRQLGADRVNTPEEAAQALAYLGKSAVERFDALITDKDGKPLAIVGAFKGAIGQADVYPATLAGEAFRVKGAANIWLAHNHPSGSAEFSQADRNLHRMLSDVFRGSEIKMRGLYAIAGKAGDGWEWVYEYAPGEPDITGTTTKPKKTASVPVVERVYAEDGRLGPSITSPETAKIIAKDIAGGLSGVLMLTYQNTPVAFVPVDASKVDELRKDGRMDVMYRALSVSNAGAAIIVNNGDMTSVGVRNLAGLLNSLDGRVIDVMETGGDTTVSWAETGKGFESKTFFQSDGGSTAPRGAFSPATNTVTLLQNADLSTFLHESAHYFFESDIQLASELLGKAELTPGEQQIVDDVGRLLTWHGIQGDVTEQLRQWHTMDFEEQRSHHERTAESFEAYLFSGKAPNLELQVIFQRFRAWMVNVYKSISDFLKRNPEAGKLNDEVRSVFDRMIATQEQIQLAEQARSLTALFASPETSGMTPDAYAAYQALGVDATNTAIEELQAKGLRDMQWLANARGRAVKKLQKESKAVRAEVTMEARREVMSQPVYRAWDFLTRKISDNDKLPPLERKSDPDVLDPTLDSLFVAIAKLGGIRKDQVPSEWGVDPKDMPQSGLFGRPVWRVTDGLTLDGMAEALAEHGYLPLNEHGQHELNDLGDRFLEELAGNTQYSHAYQPQDLQPGEQIANPAGLMAGRFDRAGLAAIGIPDEIAEHLQTLKMTAKDGLHPDLVAELFGFSSGDELARTLAAAPTPKDAINALAEQMMLERFGELASPDAIERAADQAIHNDVRARMLTTEVNALAQAIGKPKILASAAKAFAADMIARLKVRDVRPGQYANAEAKASKAADKAHKAGDTALAASEKRNQIIQHYATRAAYDAQDEVKAGLRYLKKFDKRSKTIDPEYQDQIEAMLERFELRAISNKAVDRRTSLAAWIEAQREVGLEPDIDPKLENEAFRTSYKNITVEEFRGLVDAVKQIEHLGRLKNKLLTAQDQRAFRTIVEEVAGSIVDNGGAARKVELETPKGIRPWLEGVAAGHRKIASLIRQMDGLKDGGPFWRVLVRGMNEASTNETVMIEQATVKLSELYKPMLALKGGLNGDLRSIPEIGDSLTRGGRLSVALNWGNETNRQRVMAGDQWSEYQVHAILKTLTREEWAFVQNVWTFIDSYWPAIEAKEKRVTGRAPDKVAAEPFSYMVDGEMVSLTGGYYPIKYDSNRDDRAEKHDAAAIAQDMMRGAMTRSTTRRGHTKARTEAVNRPVKKTLDVITQHVSEVTHDLAWHEWLIDANRLLDAKPINQAIRDYYGTEVLRTMKNALTSIATADIIPQDAIDRALLYLRANVSRSTMGFSLTTAFLQPFGLLQSMVRIGPTHVMRGIARWGGDAARFESSMTWISEKSDFMRLRSKTSNRELHEVKGRVNHGHSKARTIYDASLFMLMQKMQMVADVPTWIGAYEKALADNQDDATAVALADQSVLDSQLNSLAAPVSLAALR